MAAPAFAIQEAPEMAAALSHKKSGRPPRRLLLIFFFSHRRRVTSPSPLLNPKISLAQYEPQRFTVGRAVEKGAAKGYKHGVHRAEDRQRKKQPCGPKTRYDQDCALKYYEKCV